MIPRTIQLNFHEVSFISILFEFPGNRNLPWHAKNPVDKKDVLAIISIILILIFIVLFAIGLGPIPFVYSNEVFAAEARSTGLSLAMFMNWFCNFLVTLFFLPLQSVIQGYVFLVFCLFVALGFALLFFKMPETKNKKLSEIQAFWK